MWTTEHSAETQASPVAVWAALRALHTGVALSERSHRFEPHGPFAVGTKITVTPNGQDTVTSVITELVENQVYADVTRVGDLDLVFRHTLRPLPGGGTAVTHRLQIDGDGADRIGPELGPQVAGDFPETMADLLAAAEREPAQGAQ